MKSPLIEKRNLYTIIIATKLVPFDGLISRKNGSYLVAKKATKTNSQLYTKSLVFFTKFD